MFKAMICVSGMLGILVSCTPMSSEETARQDAYFRIFQAKGASLAMTLEDMVDLGLTRPVNLADPAFPPK